MELMKTALINTEVRTQIVLTAENKLEEGIMRLLKANQPTNARILFGSFYSCQGGWDRFGPNTDDSLIVIIDSKNEKEFG
jgi:hypothetical protein